MQENGRRKKITVSLLDGTTDVTDSDVGIPVVHAGDGPVYCTGLNLHVTGASETSITVSLFLSLDPFHLTFHGKSSLYFTHMYPSLTKYLPANNSELKFDSEKFA